MLVGQLTGPEIKTIRTAFTVAFSSDEFKQFVFETTDCECTTYAADGDPYPILAFKVINGLNKQRRLYELLEAALEERPKVTEIQGLKRFLPALPGDWRDPFNVSSLHLVDNLPIFDRLALRNLVPKLGDGSRRTLIINGPPRSGKTYSYYLFEFLKYSGRFKLAYCDLRELGSSSSLVPTELLALQLILSLRLGTSLPNLGPAADHAWARNFNMWLWGQLDDCDSTFWIVIDHCSTDRLDVGSRNLLYSLAQQADKNDRLRLILIDYGGETSGLQRLDREEVAPITEDHVREFFRAVYAQKRRATPPPLGAESVSDRNTNRAESVSDRGASDVFVEASMQRTWGAVAHSSEGWLEKLARSVRDEVENIRL